MSNQKSLLIFGLALGLAAFCQAQQSAAYHETRQFEAGFFENPVNSGFIFRVPDYPRAITDEASNVDISEVRKHPLGMEVAVRLYLLEKNYLYLSDAAPGSFAGKVYVQKPVIYNSIMKIDKDIRSQVKKGMVTPDEGAGRLSRYIEYALAMLNEDTGSFEGALRKAGSPTELIRLYDKISINP